MHMCEGERGETSMEFWWRNLEERRHLEDLGIEGRKILRGGRGLD